LHHTFSPWLIPVVLEPAEDDNGNNFVDNNNGLISGTVKDDKGNVLEGVASRSNFRSLTGNGGQDHHHQRGWFLRVF
jgi:hypothetical protein